MYVLCIMYFRLASVIILLFTQQLGLSGSRTLALAYRIFNTLLVECLNYDCSCELIKNKTETITNHQIGFVDHFLLVA